MTDDRSGQILGVAIAFLIPTAISTALRVYTRFVFLLFHLNALTIRVDMPSSQNQDPS